MVAALQAACDVVDGRFAGVGQRQPAAQLRGNGGGERAAGAVCIDRQTCVAEFFARHAIEITINDAVAFQ
ncbi:hypothetical protein D3C81_1830010 [compost metagenome]